MNYFTYVQTNYSCLNIFNLFFYNFVVHFLRLNLKLKFTKIQINYNFFQHELVMNVSTIFIIVPFLNFFETVLFILNIKI